MILSKSDLQYYLDEDAKQCGKPLRPTLKQRFVNWLFPDYNYEFQRCLRKLEYYTNCRTIGGGCKRLIYNKLHEKLRHKTGIELNINVAGPGLHISHGKVVVSSIAKLGEHCKLLSDVTIGGQGRYDRHGAPTLGNRVFVGSGAKIIGDITIADDVVIGANAVVTRSITEPGTTWAGNPAKKVSDNGSERYLNR